MISRLGVYGGMFDPVHNGHIKAACYTRDMLKLERVKLVPCKQPNHRDTAQATPQDRVAMLELAISGNARLEIDTCEIDRAGVSYAVDTLEYLRGAKIAEHIVFVLGIDSFNTLASWHRWEALQELCHLFVLPRANAKLNTRLTEEMRFGSNIVEHPEHLFDRDCGGIFLDKDFAHNASSTEVRRVLRERSDTGNLLDPRVLEFIVEHKLYGYNS